MWFEKGMLESRKGDEPVDDSDTLRYWPLCLGVGGRGLGTGGCGSGQSSCLFARQALAAAQQQAVPCGEMWAGIRERVTWTGRARVSMPRVGKGLLLVAFLRPPALRVGPLWIT